MNPNRTSPQKPRSSNRYAAKPRRRLLLEPLEARRVLATFIVNTIVDAPDLTPGGDGIVDIDLTTPGNQISLRGAIEEANQLSGIDRIEFNLPSGPQTISLSLGQLSIFDSLEIVGPGREQLTIDASPNDVTPGIPDGGGSRVLSLGNEGGLEAVTISDLTLTGGDVLGNGGGVSAFGVSRLLFTRVEVINNFATGDGGGIFSSEFGDHVFSLSNSVVSGNQASRGGGVYARGDGQPDSSYVNHIFIQNSQLTGNSASLLGGGGMLRSSYGEVVVSGGQFTSNSAGEGGGGLNVISDSSVSTIIGSLFDTNDAAYAGGLRVATADGPFQIESTSITGNFANSAAGAEIYRQGGVVRVEQSTISGNVTAEGGLGGGLYVHSYGYGGGSFTLSNSTVSGNSGPVEGGGIFYRGAYFGSGGGSANLTIEQSTIVRNSVTDISDVNASGGGVFIDIGYSGSARILGTVIAENVESLSSSPRDAFFGQFDVVDVRFSLLGDNAGSGLDEAPVGTPDSRGNLIGNALSGGLIDPLVGLLIDNGGLTQTHAILPGSPLVDAGDPNLAGLLTDQRGAPFSRILDGDGDLMAVVDMGAFEADEVFPFEDVAAISIKSRVEGLDADVPAGPQFAAGDVMTFTYEVTNDGTLTLENVRVVDDAGTADPADDVTPLLVEGDANENGLLDFGEVWRFQSTQPIRAGATLQTATVSADALLISDSVSNTDAVNYVGIDSSIVVERRIEGMLADMPPGITLAAGSTAEFTYFVTNNGLSQFVDVNLIDDAGTTDPLDDLIPVAITTDGVIDGDTDADNVLDPGETWSFRTTAVVMAGMVESTAEVTATSREFITMGGQTLARVPSAFELRDAASFTIFDPLSPTSALAEFEFNFGPEAAISPNLGTPFTIIVDGEFLRLDGQRFEFESGPAITFNLFEAFDIDNEILTITDSALPPNSVAFEFDYDGITRSDTVVIPSSEARMSPSVVMALINEIMDSPLQVEVIDFGLAHDQFGLRGDSSVSWTGGDSRGINVAGDYGVAPDAIAIPLELDANSNDAFLAIMAAVSGAEIAIGGSATRLNFPESSTLDVTNVAAIFPLGSNTSLGANQINLFVEDSSTTVATRMAAAINTLFPGQASVGQPYQAADGTIVSLNDFALTHTLEANTIEVGGPDLVSVSATAFYLGGVPAIEFEVTVEGESADLPPGPTVAVGQSLTFEYLFTNTSNLPLSNVSVIDDAGTPLDLTDDVTLTLLAGDLGSDGILDAGETWFYRAIFFAEEGAQVHTATAIATDLDGDVIISAIDRAHYLGQVPQVRLESFIQGSDREQTLLAGNSGVYRYVVTNLGAIDLMDVQVADDNGTPADITDDFFPLPRESLGVNVGDANGDRVLNPGERWTFETVLPIRVGRFEHQSQVAVVSGDYSSLPVVVAHDMVAINGFSLASGQVRFDRTGDGPSSDDPPVTGELVQLIRDDGDGNLDGSDFTVDQMASNPNGYYEFTITEVGTYFVRLGPSSLQTVYGGEAADGAYQINIRETTSIIDQLNFGVVVPSNLFGRVTEDRTGNGPTDDDSPLANLNVVVIRDNGNGVRDEADVVQETLATNANGQFQIENLFPGRYFVELPESERGGRVLTEGGNLGNEYYTIDLFGDELFVQPLNFLLEFPSELTGTLWDDQNANGLRDVHEPGLAAISVELLNDLGILIATTETNTQGEYRFEGLSPGPYEVRPATNPAWPTTFPHRQYREYGQLDVATFLSDLKTADLDRDGSIEWVISQDTVDSLEMLGPQSAISIANFGRDNQQIVLPHHIRPQELVLLDVDGDGDLDIVAAAVGDPLQSEWQRGGVVVIRNLGQGVFGEPQITAAGDGPLSLDFGDINRDGFADLVVANSRSRDLTVLMGDGSGQFEVARTIVVGPGLSKVRMADVDRDGNLEIFAGARDQLMRWEISVSGGLQMLTPLPFDRPTDFWIEHLDGDLHLDLVVGSQATGTVGYYAGDGTGQLIAARQWQLDPYSAIELADINRDGLAELTYARGNSFAWHTIYDLAGETRTIERPTQSNLLSPRSLTFSDLDQNGTFDALVADYVGNVYLFDGDRKPTDVDVLQGESLFDVNFGYVRLESVVTQSFLPRQNRANRADVNRDGVVSPLDALLVINHLDTPEATSPYLLDVDGNGLMGPLDALLVINTLDVASRSYVPEEIRDNGPHIDLRSFTPHYLSDDDEEEDEDEDEDEDPNRTLST